MVLASNSALLNIHCQCVKLTYSLTGPAGVVKCFNTRPAVLTLDRVYVFDTAKFGDLVILNILVTAKTAEFWSVKVDCLIIFQAIQGKPYLD